MKISDIEHRKRIIMAHVQKPNRFIVSALAMTDELWNTLSKVLRDNQGENFQQSKMAGQLIRSAYNQKKNEMDAAGKVEFSYKNKKVSFYNKEFSDMARGIK